MSGRDRDADEEEGAGLWDREISFEEKGNGALGGTLGCTLTATGN